MGNKIAAQFERLEQKAEAGMLTKAEHAEYVKLLKEPAIKSTGNDGCNNAAHKSNNP